MGPAVAEVARRLRKPLMPWQEYVADVSLELLPDGRFAYDEVGLTVPRQSGKSTLILAKFTHRATALKFFGSRQRMVYTAQSRAKAREKMLEDYLPDLEASKSFGPRVHAHLSNGNEHIRFTNGSRFAIEATTESSGHGATIDEAYLDEAFALQDNRMEQAFRPAMITRPNKQMWVVSTAGWEDGSPFLEDKVRRGRQAVELGETQGMAYFEWSAAHDADPHDRSVWWGCMPALGHTISEDAIAAELRAMEDDLNGFRRAYLNQWVPRDEPDEAVFDPQQWAALTDDESQPEDPVAFAVDVPYDRSSASIGIAGVRSDGVEHVEVVEDAGNGTDWVPQRVAELVARWKPVGVGLDASGPAGSLIEPLKALGVDPVCVSTREMTQACGGFYDAVKAGSVRHRGQAALSEAVWSAKKRSVGESWVWQRKGTDSPSPLIAVTVARHVRQLKPKGRQRSGVVW